MEKRIIQIVTPYLFENLFEILNDPKSSILNNCWDLEQISLLYDEGSINQGDLVYQFTLEKVFQVTTRAEFSPINMDKIILGHNDPNDYQPRLKDLK